MNRRVYFFDTSALIHRYLDGPSSRTIRRIVSDKRNKCFTAEVCIVEMSSAFGRRLRGGNFSHQRFDQLEKMFFSDISNGLLEIYPLKMQDYTRARGLLRYAGMVKRRRLTSFDSLIACSSLDLAYREKSKITFCTSDRPLYSILSDINAFTSALDLRFYPPAPTV